MIFVVNRSCLLIFPTLSYINKSFPGLHILDLHILDLRVLDLRVLDLHILVFSDFIFPDLRILKYHITCLLQPHMLISGTSCTDLSTNVNTIHSIFSAHKQKEEITNNLCLCCIDGIHNNSNPPNKQYNTTCHCVILDLYPLHHQQLWETLITMPAEQRKQWVADTLLGSDTESKQRVATFLQLPATPTNLASLIDYTCIGHGNDVPSTDYNTNRNLHIHVNSFALLQYLLIRSCNPEARYRIFRCNYSGDLSCSSSWRDFEENVSFTIKLPNLLTPDSLSASLSTLRDSLEKKGILLDVINSRINKEQKKADISLRLHSLVDVFRFAHEEQS